MINRPFSFSFLFHEGDGLAYRKQVFLQYAKKYIVRLYRLRSGFAFPELVFRDDYSDTDFVHASGIVVGDKLSEYQPGVTSSVNPFGFYQYGSSLQFIKNQMVEAGQ